MSLLRHIGLYLDAIVRGWVSLVSGVAGVLLLVLVIFFSDRYAVLRDNKTTFVWLAFICLLVAGFSAWRNERLKWETLVTTAIPKTFLTATPDELIRVFEGRTTVQGEQLAKAYEGKWLQVEGPVKDVQSDGLDLETDYRLASVSLTFDEKWQGSLNALRKGDRITAQGQIQVVGSGYVILGNCELVEVSGTSTASKQVDTPKV